MTPRKKPVERSTSPKNAPRREQIPKWVKSVPKLTSHGSGDLQQRLWRLTSDFVRIRDWEKWGVCVATGRPIEHWTQGDAGHFRPYSVCRGMFKFSPDNIFLQSKRSNGFGEYDDWIRFEIEVTRRTGHTKLTLDNLNRMHELKLPTSAILEQMEEILNRMKTLKEKPEYYEKVINRIEEN